jgi:hypothetical protein
VTPPRRNQPNDRTQRTAARLLAIALHPYRWVDDAPLGQIVFRSACVVLIPMYGGVILVGLLGMWLT